MRKNLHVSEEEEYRTIRWQEKIFSNEELKTYADVSELETSRVYRYWEFLYPLHQVKKFTIILPLP